MITFYFWVLWASEYIQGSGLVTAIHEADPAPTDFLPPCFRVSQQTLVEVWLHSLSQWGACLTSTGLLGGGVVRTNVGYHPSCCLMHLPCYITVGGYSLCVWNDPHRNYVSVFRQIPKRCCNQRPRSTARHVWIDLKPGMYSCF